MDNFKVIYRILSYLEHAMDYEEPNTNRILPEALGISDSRWTAIIEMLTKEGLISGFAISRSPDGMIEVSFSDPRIKLKGLEYLEENTFMLRAAREYS